MNENYALTAAHCVHKGEPQDFTLYFGILRQNDTKTATLRYVVEVVVHENYYYPTPDNDIALLKLDEPLQYSNVIQPIKLPNTKEDFISQLVTVSGWGETESLDSTSSEELRYIHQRIMERKICKERAIMAEPPVQLTKGMLCATTHDEEPRTICRGDSGGPVVLKDTSILVGIASFVVGYECGDTTDYYVRVSHYIDWIEAHTKNIEK